MKKIVAALSVSILISVAASAQTPTDALRYSQLTFGGTGKAMGTAGASGALGGDFGGLSVNPAGIGIFQGGQLSFSPSFYSTKTSSEFTGEKQVDRKYNFNINGFGLVFVKKYDSKKTDWRNINFAFGMNRVANFYTNQLYSGLNQENSLLDAMVAKANGNGPANLSPFDTRLAYDTYLLYNQTNDSTQYFPTTEQKEIKQQQSLKSTGKINEYVFSLGANYRDKLYFGGTLGLSGLSYNSNINYTETDINNSISYFKNYTYSQSLQTGGTGINGKFGLIYRINDYVRIGGAAHTPTRYYLTDNYSASITSDIDTLSPFTSNSPSGSIYYNLTTPWRLVGSAAFIIKKYGFISADYEWVDYSQTFYNYGGSASMDDQFYANMLNDSIRANYGPASNIRVGGEFAYDVFRFRAGYALYGSPFQADKGVTGFRNSTQSFTGGVGISDEGFFMDLGYARSQKKEFYQPYYLKDGVVPGVGITNWVNNFVFTIGFKF